MPKASLNAVCLLAREAGLVCLNKMLMDNHFRIVAIATHPFLPVAESLEPKERAEYSLFKQIADHNKIPLITVHTKNEASLEALVSFAPWDILISCSWRFHVPAHILSKSRLGNINLHRGKLPEYAGAEPIKRALQNGDTQVTVTAHEMADEIDKGAVLAEKSQRVSRLAGESLESSVERIKKEILPLYPEALWAALNTMEGKKLV